MINIGEKSYFRKQPTVVGDGSVNIGKYCSIGENVRFITWGHHIDWFTSFIFEYAKETKQHPVYKGGITIGNDVWIGDSVVILDGVKVGDGAVISAGSVVSKNVKPYTVVGGNPAEFLFSRFNSEIIDLLLKFKWWELPEKKINEIVPILCSNNFEKLKDYYMTSNYYKEIHGWIDFEDIYSEVVKNANDDAHFVEIGAWLGKSTIYMCTEIKNSNKNIKFDTIDSWEYTPELIDFDEYDKYIKETNNNPYSEFIKNIEPVKQYVSVIKSKSSEASKLYKNDSLDFVFIDGDHSYEGVKQDLKDWYPKIKNGGIIAGHDYYEGVKKAVDEFFQDDKINKFSIRNTSWFHKKIDISKFKL